MATMGLSEMAMIGRDTRGDMRHHQRRSSAEFEIFSSCVDPVLHARSRIALDDLDKNLHESGDVVKAG
jgi:hypothetical protein